MSRSGGAADRVHWTLTDHLNTVRDIAQFDPQTGASTVVNRLVYPASGCVAAVSAIGPVVNQEPPASPRQWMGLALALHRQAAGDRYGFANQAQALV